ncbi:MAG: hypothetical protein JNM56_19520 [Planctomycetia bacterium]|nr:hypothetical protein [Planctomycetia bacterium]
MKDELARHDAQIHQSMSEIGLHDPDQAVAGAHSLAVKLGLTRETISPQNLGAISALAELLSTSVPAQLNNAQETARELDAAKAKNDLRRSLEQEQSALADSLRELRDQRDRASSQRATCAATVRSISERLAANRERIAMIDELRSGYERLTSLDGDLRASEVKLAALTPQQQAETEVQACRFRIVTLEQEIASVQEQYYQKRKSLLDAEQTLQKAIGVRGMLTNWLASQAERDECRDRLSEVTKRREDLNQQAEELELEQARLARELSSAQEHMAQLGRALSERNQLLIALQAHIDGDQCPLCRHTWPTHAALVAAVESASSAGSPELQRLEETQRAAVSNLADVRKRVSECRTALAEVEQTVRVVCSRLQELDAATTTLTAALRQLSSEPSPGSGSMVAVESAISSAQTNRDATLGEIQAIDKRLHGLQIDLEHAKEGLAGQEERRTTSGAERRNLEIGITQIRAELDSIRARSDQHTGGDLRNLIEEEASTQNTIRTLTRELEVAKADLGRADDELQAVTELEQQARSITTSNESRLDGLVRELDRLGLDHEGANLGTLAEAASQKCRALTSLSELVPTVVTYARLKTVREATDKTRGEWETVSAEARSIRERIDQLDAMIAQCDRFISDLSRVAKDEETRRLKEYGPTINQIYQRLNRHPYFGDLVFEVDQANGEFKVQVGYRRDKDSAVAAVDYFSASQANVLALSVFLTSALLQNWSTLSTIILDDPVQHLDDLNTQSLLDLLQGLASLDRQVIVTTSNIGLYKLMLIKYAHLNAGRPKSFKAFRLRGIRHEGPEVFDDTAAAT